MPKRGLMWPKRVTGPKRVIVASKGLLWPKKGLLWPKGGNVAQKGYLAKRGLLGPKRSLRSNSY